MVGGEAWQHWVHLFPHTTHTHTQCHFRSPPTYNTMSTRPVAPCLPGQPRAHHLTPAAAALPTTLTLLSRPSRSPATRREHYFGSAPPWGSPGWRSFICSWSHFYFPVSFNAAVIIFDTNFILFDRYDLKCVCVCMCVSVFHYQHSGGPPFVRCVAFSRPNCACVFLYPRGAYLP